MSEINVGIGKTPIKTGSFHRGVGEVRLVPGVYVYRMLIFSETKIE